MVNGVNIKALTWNMGNKPPSQNAVEDIFMQLGTSSPDVLSISTQEELAPNGKRLVDLLKAKLEEDGSQYELVETYHTTMAGANNSKRTLFKALTSDDNRVSTAVLVKKPYTLKNAETRIDYQSSYDAKDQNKKVNKSVITVQGQLADKDGKPIMDISVSGGHFDANQDQKRRAHTNKFLKNSGLKDKSKTFADIYNEASAFKIVTGDFNERNQLFGSLKKPFDMMKQTNFKSYGFDIEKQPKMIKGNQPLNGTYGLNGIDEPDPKTERKHVAKGGFLDRVAYTCGLKVKEGHHGFMVNPKYMEANKKGKQFYHGSDHLPVLRSFEVTPPDPKQQEAIVAAHIIRRLPDFKSDIKDLKTLLINASNETELLKALDELPLQHHDSEYTKEQFIRMYAGVRENASFKEVVDGLQKKQSTLEGAQQSFDKIAGLMKGPPQPDRKLLETVFNQINKCNDLKNALQEINDIPEKKMSKEDKAAFIQLASKLVDDMYESAGKRLNGEKANIPTNLQLTQLLEKYSKLAIVGELKKAKDQAVSNLQKIEFAIDPKQATKPIPMNVQIPKPMPIQSRNPNNTAVPLPAQRFDSKSTVSSEPVALGSHRAKGLTSIFSSLKNNSRVQKENEPPKLEPDQRGTNKQAPK